MIEKLIRFMFMEQVRFDLLIFDDFRFRQRNGLFRLKHSFIHRIESFDPNNLHNRYFT